MEASISSMPRPDTAKQRRIDAERRERERVFLEIIKNKLTHKELIAEMKMCGLFYGDGELMAQWTKHYVWKYFRHKPMTAETEKHILLFLKNFSDRMPSMDQWIRLRGRANIKSMFGGDYVRLRKFLEGVYPKTKTYEEARKVIWPRTDQVDPARSRRY